ncbi:nitrile hydratase accessory protein [Hoeflea phototrophica DFL-43]|uniref:Nitrile hydratase accessory protein n=1 Tax=Hoeflea phototrophica (strain DSM 17068 / NCIMB 14078 / DFL-43) TaxID=411684 RepID=A9D3M5_HOEPD|nr:nitrile hydratase accessory protein [Hoeflea phototrophica DFL-43]
MSTSERINPPQALPFRLPGGETPDAPVFAEPWQAQAFALAVALNERGLFTWSEWAAELSRQVASPAAAQDGSDYYEHWLAALEALITAKGIAGQEAIDAMSDAWQRAAHATPHGMPILLENDPGRG